MGEKPNEQIIAMLAQDADGYTWVAATTGANEAAGYQLATGDAVMPIGGFMGGDPSPTLAQFQQYVEDGRIHYYIEGRGPRVPGGGDGHDAAQQQRPTTEADKIREWVMQNFTATTVDGVTYYDLVTPAT